MSIAKQVKQVTGPLNGYEQYLVRANKHQGAEAVITIIAKHRAQLAIANAIWKANQAWALECLELGFDIQ